MTNGKVSSDLPRLAVLYEPAAFSGLEIAEAASGLCELVWVTGWSSAIATPIERLLPRLGTVIDVRGWDTAHVIQGVKQAQVDGIIVFSDAPQELAATIAEALNLRFHSRSTARQLRDKFEQRRALKAAGMPVPAVATVRRSTVSSPAAAQALPMRWPAVLKPRRGSGGSNTFLVSDPAELLATLGDASDDREFILEEYFEDRSPTAAQTAADLVSVELLVSDGVSEHIGVAGRFPLVPPLRENGGFLPSHLDPADATAAVRVAGEAAAALGVQFGILHIELKMTPRGPRIIEVNGRVGGIVPSLLARIGGPPVLSWAMRLALGLDLGPLTPVGADSPIAFYYAWLPPLGEYRVAATTGVEQVMALPEVDRFWLNRQIGDRVSSQEGGMFGYLAAAYGTVATHDELWALSSALQSNLSFGLEPVSP